MKQIKDYICEAYKSQRLTTLHFDNISSALMFSGEMAGQISDGKYENSRPESHWYWVGNVSIVVDGSEEYDGPKHRINYNLREWVKGVKQILSTGDGGDYDFAYRLYCYGKIGRCITNPKDIISTDKDGRNYIDTSVCTVGELFGNTLRKNEKATWDDVIKTSEERSWYKDYLSKPSAKKIFTKEIFEKFKELNYTFSDFRGDVASMEATVNTQAE